MQKLMKRGISPLIATILIIGFTVALAAVIMTWGQSFTKSVTEGTEASTEEQLVCAQDVKFDVKDACVVDPAPGLENTIKLTVSNDGNKKIESFAVRYYIAADNVKVATFVPLAAFGIVTAQNNTLAGDAERVKKVEMIPIVKVGENLITCANSFESFGESDLVTGSPLRNC